MSSPVLTYFNGRGLAESIRLMLAAAGVDFTENFLKTPEDIAKLRNEGVLTYQQVPLLQWDGMNLVQTVPILRYIARKYNMMGKPDEQYQVEMLMEGARDFYKPFLGIEFNTTVEEVKATMTDKFMPRYMPVFEKKLTSSKSGFLVGDSMTLADVAFFEVLLVLKEIFADSCCTNYPKCKEFYEKMKATPRLSAFLNSPKRHGPNTPEYIKEVKYVLGMP